MGANRYRRPFGGSTTNVGVYVREWRHLAEPFERHLGWRMYGFDPALLFAKPGPGLWGTETVSVEVAAFVRDILSK